MNCEQYVTNILQSASQTLDSENYNFLLSCSSFQLSQFFSQSFDSLQNTSISTHLNNVIYYYFIKAIINENSTENFKLAIEYIIKLHEEKIETNLIELQLINQLINSVSFDSKDSLISVYTLIPTIDRENTESNFRRFFEKIHIFIKSKWDEDFDAIQYAGIVLSTEFDSKYTSDIRDCFDKIFLSIFRKLFREGNLEGFLKFKKFYAQYLSKENQEVEEKYKGLVGSRFLEIAERGQFPQNLQEIVNIGQRTLVNNLIYYSVLASEDWYFRLVTEVVHLDLILNRVLQTEIAISGVKKSPGKIDLVLDIKKEVSSLRRTFDLKQSLSFFEFCSIFYEISRFLVAFKNYPIRFCLDPSCILLVPSGPAILIPDESFCVVPKDSASLAASLSQNLANCSLALLMRDSIKYLVCSEEELEDLLRCIELIRTWPQVTIEQIQEYFLTKL